MPQTPPHTPEDPGSPVASPPQGKECSCNTVPLVGSLVANTLADSLGVSPLYKQQDSARWNYAAQAYKSSRCVSPTLTGSNPQFNFDDDNAESAPARTHNLIASLRQTSQSNVAKLMTVCSPLAVHFAGRPYTTELTMKGWRVASEHTDSMNGDYAKVELHTRYFRNARELLNFLSPDHVQQFNESLAERLRELQASQCLLGTSTLLQTQAEPQTVLH